MDKVNRVYPRQLQLSKGSKFYKDDKMFIQSIESYYHKFDYILTLVYNQEMNFYLSKKSQ